MSDWQVQRQVKYESELDPSFPRDILSMPGGENLRNCIQCGTCSSACPLSIYMDYTPRRIIAMARAGFRDEVLKSFTIWLCASCYECWVECPKNIEITDIMYTLKRRAIKEKVYPRRFRIPVLSEEFLDFIMKRGRNNEIRLIIRMYMKTNPFMLLKNAVLGMKLFLKSAHTSPLPHKKSRRNSSSSGTHPCEDEWMVVSRP